MTQPEQVELQQRSSVKLSLNAKRDVQWEIKVVAGDDESVLDEARRIALKQHRELSGELGVLA